MTVPDIRNSDSNELKILISPQKIVDHGASCSDPCLLQWFGRWTILMPGIDPSALVLKWVIMCLGRVLDAFLALVCKPNESM